MSHPSGQHLFKSASRGVWALALALAFIVCLVVAWVAWYEKNVIIQNERDRAALFARVLEDQVARTLEFSSQASSELVEEMTFVQQRNLERLRPTLQKALASMTAVRSLSIVDSGGKILMSSHAPDEGQRIDLKKLEPAPQSGNTEIGSIIPVRYLGELEQPRTENAVVIHSLPMIRYVQGMRGNKYFLVTLLNTITHR